MYKSYHHFSSSILFSNLPLILIKTLPRHPRLFHRLRIRQGTSKRLIVLPYDLFCHFRFLCLKSIPSCLPDLFPIQPSRLYALSCPLVQVSHFLFCLFKSEPDLLSRKLHQVAVDTLQNQIHLFARQRDLVSHCFFIGFCIDMRFL